MSKKSLIILKFFIFFTLLGMVAFTHSFPETALAPLKKVAETVAQKVEPSPTPFPFQEMTIPYLRSRSFTSSLGKLQQYQSTGTYTSYITKYDSDGLTINALLTIPKGEVPPNGFPAVVFIHGYIPPESYRTTERYDSHIDYLARSGIVVLKIDLRGHGDSEGVASGAYYSGNYVIDTLNAYAALETQEYVDSTNIGLWGHSMAGNVVLRAVAAKKNIAKAVIWAGAVYTYDDFAEYRISDASYSPPETNSVRSREREQFRDMYGSYTTDSWFWQQVPATNYLDEVTTAIQVHHAVNDDVVSIEYSRGLAEILKKTTIPFELYEYQSGGHNITGTAFTQAMQRTTDFFIE
ncbi:MAG: alpha/beta fold hydrolase [Pseudomonadales bacterium]|nr:alpha/beta fold hydrolase [Candidatus Woesebacteria bacterium]MCB9800982.1 alpha/beta fold hydrolase [Pseudomonadales bacterium]